MSRKLSTSHQICVIGNVCTIVLCLLFSDISSDESYIYPLPLKKKKKQQKYTTILDQKVKGTPQNRAISRALLTGLASLEHKRRNNSKSHFFFFNTCILPLRFLPGKLQLLSSVKASCDSHIPNLPCMLGGLMFP